MIPEGHRLSWARVVIALVVVGVVAAGAVGAVRWQDEIRAFGGPEERTPSTFSGYVDVTATPRYAFESPSTDAQKDVVLSFVVADHDEPCTPTWGGFHDLDGAAAELDLDRRVALLRERGGDVTVSFGGLANDELATACTDPKALLAAYRSVVERYDLRTIDLDVEDDDLTNREAATRRASVLQVLQKERAAEDEPLDVWLTLPAATQGLTEDGLALVEDTVAAGVDLTGVNAMTMNYGESREPDESMTDATRRTLEAVHDQLGPAYEAAGAELSDAELWERIGMTPMAGQNDVPADVVTIDDARELAALGEELGVGRVSLWSLNRDRACGVNYPDPNVVSDACSGVPQDGETFADVLAAGAVTGARTTPGAPRTTASPTPSTEVTDDPATSPYRIWDADASYPEGTKVVWRRQVYEAKWWTSGDVPDDPVATADQTPWQLLGPVLPGDRPTPRPTVAAGTYPEWSRTGVYRKGARVVVDGVPYRAKWWTEGDHPEVAETNPDASPWVPLTAEEIARIGR
jgi:chitinase